MSWKPIKPEEMKEKQLVYRGRVTPFRVYAGASRILRLFSPASGWIVGVVDGCGRRYDVTQYDDPTQAAEARKRDGSISGDDFWIKA